MKLFFVFAIFALCVPASFALQAGHIGVLTVSQDNQEQGGVADIYLEIRPGSGLTFIDSFPLTKVDTQISTRFAREYACALADVDCSKLDFFYVIRAHSSLVAGPSAGAAMTVLSYTTLQNLDLREDTIMTGTINSGGLIGPVGGTTQKALAAREAGFTRVLVPQEQESSVLVENIDIIPVSDIEEAIFYFTGEDVRPEIAPIVVPDAYRMQMEDVMTQLCDHTQSLLSSAKNVSNQTSEWLVLADEAAAQQKYYSAASYCFSAGLDIQKSLIENKSQLERRRIYRQLEKDIEVFDQTLPKQFDTIADLEVYMIVRERLLESYDIINDLDDENISADSLGYALERFASAVTWSSFFSVIPSKKVTISDAQLEESCLTKLAESDERINYVSIIAGINLEDTRTILRNAQEYQRQKEWALCMFSATKAKAQADSVLSAWYGGDLNATVQRKLAKTQEVLGLQAARGNFPILAFSYYEYAQDLDDAYSANLYAEYALELSGLEIFFADRSPRRIYDYSRILLLISGLAIGASAGILGAELLHRRKTKKHNNKRKKR